MKIPVTFPRTREPQSWIQPIRFARLVPLGGRFSRRRLFRATDPFNRLLSGSADSVKYHETFDH